jgi:lipopolysaccharide/colanic/teichoic acid biosynthesis glycosyltransferase
LGADIVIPRVSEERLIPRTGSRSQAVSNTNSNFDLGHVPAKGLSTDLTEISISSWSGSNLKRVFDFACVALLLPLLFPLFLVIGLVVLATSRGPVFFLQKRTGRRGRIFTILKFRTMEDLSEGERNNITTTQNQRFTLIGRFLRRWKLDELPQLLNVFIGDMSLVGPRPKIPEHQLGNLQCRPGITGAATIAFAREEQVFARLPHHHLASFFHSVVLPAKLRLDSEYMAHATFLSDLSLIAKSVLRRWDSKVMFELLPIELTDRQAYSEYVAPTLKDSQFGGAIMAYEEAD